jgi:GNAT superfamily N-acetyltransferase
MEQSDTYSPCNNPNYSGKYDLKRVKFAEMTERLFRRHLEKGSYGVMYVSTSFELKPRLYSEVTAQSVNYSAFYGKNRLGFLYGIFFIHAESDGYGMEYIEEGRSVKIGDLKVGEKYRRHGIGKRLLGSLESDAKLFGASELFGVVTQEDLQESLWLPEFYERCGYQVKDENGFLELLKRINET